MSIPKARHSFPGPLAKWRCSCRPRFLCIRSISNTGSIALTSNRDRAEWPDLFGEALLASAALDRLTHGAHFVEITGASFRAEHTRKQIATRRGRAAN